MLKKITLEKVLAVLLALICTFVGITYMLIYDARVTAQAQEEALALAQAEEAAKEAASGIIYSVPASGMSVVLSEYVSSNEGSAVDHLTTTAVAAAAETGSEFVNTQGSAVGKYIVCTAETYASVYSEPNDLDAGEDSSEEATGDNDDESGITEIGRIYTYGLAALVSMDGDWCYVISGDIAGYVKTSDFAFAGDAESLDESTYITTAVTLEDEVYCYELANTKSTVECILPEGIELEYISDTGYGFLLVYVDGVGECYVLTSQMEVSTCRHYAVSLEDVTARTASINQGIADASDLDPSFIWPLAGNAGKLTSTFGWRNGKMHYGLDFSCSSGTAIYAVMDGTVVENYYESSAGNAIVIYHGSGLYTVYFHMKYRSELEVGTTVTQGDVIGYVGASGNSTGYHLHFAVGIGGYKAANFVDPSSYLGL